MIDLLDALKILFAFTIFFDFIIVCIYICYSKLQKISMKTLDMLFIVLIFWEIILWIEFFVITPISLQLFVDQLAFAIGTMVVIFSILFVWEITGKSFFTKKSLLLVLSPYYILACIVFIPGALFSGRIYYSDAPYNYSLIAGPLLNIYYIILAIAPVLIGMMLWKGFKKANELQKLRIGTVGIGLFFMICSTVFANVWIQLYGYIVYDNFFIAAEKSVVTAQIFSGIAISFFTFSTLYAIGRYRFLGLKIVMKKTIFIFFITLCIVGGSTALIFFLSLYTSTITLFFVSGIFLIFGLYLRKWISYILDGVSFFQNIDFTKNLSDGASKLNSEHKTKTYALEVNLDIQKELLVDVLDFLVLQRQHNRLYSCYPYNKTTSISLDTQFFKALQAQYSNDVIIQKKSDVERSVYQYMKKKNAEIILISRFENTIQGIIFLSEKKDKSDFTNADLDFLKKIALSTTEELHALIYWHETIERLKNQLKNEIFNSY